MKKNKKVLTLIIISSVTALILWVVSNLKTISNLDIFDIEKD